MIKSKIVGLVVPRMSVTNPTSAEAPHIPAWAAAVGPAGDKLFFRGTNGQPLRNATSKWGEIKLVPFSKMGLSKNERVHPKFLASLDLRLLTSPSNDRSTQTCCDWVKTSTKRVAKIPSKIPWNSPLVVQNGPGNPWDCPKWTLPGVFMRLFAQQRSGSHWAKQAMYWSQRGDLKKMIEKQVGYAWSKKKIDKTWDWKGFLIWRQPQMHDNSCIFHHAWE